MKKHIYILLTSLYLISSTDLRELIKLPILVVHYFEHKQVDQKTTFIYFINHHYNNDEPHTDDDEERDNQLPFKSNDFCACAVWSPALPINISYKLKKVFQLLPKHKIIIHNDFIPSSAYAGKIWQPPKIA